MKDLQLLLIIPLVSFLPTSKYGSGKILGENAANHYKQKDKCFDCYIVLTFFSYLSASANLAESKELVDDQEFPFYPFVPIMALQSAMPQHQTVTCILALHLPC
ncbi:MAG: hypothetical protein IPL46_20045 [Saprospiraceae bacterium]|nr:hypothetical protein [Saprospiraceae bacterium]